MEQHYIEITKTARYYTLGNLNKQTKEIWFMLHGYAQLAKEVIQKFEHVSNNSNYIVAPEGLNKFYAKGFFENPVANWMTSEDRKNEIKDYCNYLNQLYNYLQIDNKIKVNVLGFSQGVSTATRWIESNSFIFNKLVILAGEIAKEFQTQLPPKLSTIETIFLYGNKDPFIERKSIDDLLALYHSSTIKIIEFDGGHEIKEDSLVTLFENQTSSI
jgi:predicted esterase